jgi:ATP-dependent Lon protease
MMSSEIVVFKSGISSLFIQGLARIEWFPGSHNMSVIQSRYGGNDMNPYSQSQQINQIIHQLTQQTQQASMAYQQMLKQEQQNAMQLEQLAQREQQTSQMIQTALQGHQRAIQQLQQISSLAQQMVSSVSQPVSGYMETQQPQGFQTGFNNQFRQQ